jgi:tRNA threonylcarbamoyladenosine biosynthesis protein TsaB
MAYILHIETATKVCSVGLAKDNTLIALKEDKSLQYSHSTLLTSFVQDVLKEAEIDIKRLDAIAVSMGPGSYTGLRIGVSTAKGICYALDIPLIAINTLRILARLAKSAISGKEIKYIVPMIDARRMEVYNSVFGFDMDEERNTIAEIIDENSFNEYLAKGKVVFCGDGASKCAEIVKHPNAIFLPEVLPSALGMLNLAYSKFLSKEFEDLAYFEPFYLKDFVAGKPRVKGLT